MASCPNLRELAGERFKVRYEESYYADRRRHTVVDPWLMVVPCQSGHICPWGEGLLAYCSDGGGAIVRAVMALPFVRIVQRGSDGANVSFPADRFEEVVRIVKPRRRRRLSPESRAKLAEVSRRGRETAARNRELRVGEAPSGPGASAGR